MFLGLTGQYTFDWPLSGNGLVLIFIIPGFAFSILARTQEKATGDGVWLFLPSWIGQAMIFAAAIF